jgi:hypothetical protein
MVRWTPSFRQPDGVNKVDSFLVMKPERRPFEHSPDCGELWGGLGLWETGAVSGFP